MQAYKKIDFHRNKDVVLRYIPGHFITPKSHVNYYMDLSDGNTGTYAFPQKAFHMISSKLKCSL